MDYCFYSIVSVRNDNVIVSQPFRQNFSMATLCDTARSLSLDYQDAYVSIYKFFIQSPCSTKLLYRFFNGKLCKV